MVWLNESSLRNSLSQLYHTWEPSLNGLPSLLSAVFPLPGPEQDRHCQSRSLDSVYCFSESLLPLTEPEPYFGFQFLKRILRWVFIQQKPGTEPLWVLHVGIGKEQLSITFSFVIQILFGSYHSPLLQFKHIQVKAGTSQSLALGPKVFNGNDTMAQYCAI